ncbi:MAG: SIS domain-containing protein [Erysipelotrichaceae bacterium]|nr:SIS domain-containing protein [Erysipelotrichaceae bacterium]
MKVWQKYLEVEMEALRKIEETQAENIEKAARILAECTKNDGIIRVFGCGHSHLVADEVFYRSATLGNVQAVLEEAVTGNTQIYKSGFLEKMEGYAEKIVDYTRLQKNDVVICISNSGNNAVTLEFAKVCQERGYPVIVLSNPEYSETLKPRHSSGKHLKDFGDVVISNCSPIGDAAVEIEGMPMKVGATSSIPFLFLINAILAEAVDMCVKDGFIPDVYYNGSLRVNNPKIGEHNFAIIDKYFYRMRNL